MECKLCKMNINEKGFGSHLKIHKVSKDEYVKRFMPHNKNNSCKTCGKKTKLKSFIKGFQIFCNLKCHNSNAESKLKNGASKIGRERLDMVGDLNPAKRKSVREKISKKLQGNDHGKYRKISSEQRRLISERMTQYWILNPERKLSIVSNHKQNYKSGSFYSLKNNKTYHYRSSYELVAFEKLELDDNVKSYTYETLLIEYLDDEMKIRHYKPDFIVTYINNDICIIEVKPKKLINENGNTLKHDAAREFTKENNMEFLIWTEIDLF